jgi:hypothetical protein
VDEPLEPEDVLEFQQEQAARIRKFLSGLARDDELLLAYFRNRVEVLQEAAREGPLEAEDVALLLESNHSRVSEVMQKGSAAVRWICIWIV